MKRDYLFDNYKAFLITLVVMGHFIEPACENNAFLDQVRWLIVSFHMPAFVFISGYFSKRAPSGAELFCKVALPYVSLEVVYYLFYTFIMHKETELYLLHPKFTLWYLLALFAWRAATPHVKKIPHYLPLSFMAGLLVGFWTGSSNLLSIPRIVYFYPFFLMGSDTQREEVSEWRRGRGARAAAAAAVAAIAAFLVIGPFRYLYPAKIFYGRYGYESLGQGAMEGVVCRAACYVIGLALTIAFLLLMPERREWFSYIGTRTMAIYVFHGLCCAYIKECTEILSGADTLPGGVALLAFCVLLVLVFSMPPFARLADCLMAAPVGRWVEGRGKRNPAVRPKKTVDTRGLA